MRKSISDILCGASFLAISAAFGLQYEGLTGVSRVFPESLILINRRGWHYGLWAMGLYETARGNVTHRRGTSRLEKKLDISPRWRPSTPR